MTDFFLYKYLHPSLTSVLENGMLRFTQPNALNDPYEFRPFVKEFLTKTHLQNLVHEEVAKINLKELAQEAFEKGFREYSREERRHILKKINKNHLIENYLAEHQTALLEGAKKHAIESAQKVLPDLVDAGLRAFGEKLGVLCLSESPLEQLMWAHYADSHRGFVLEFDANHPFFKGTQSDPNDYSGVNKVVYSPERPQIEEFLNEGNSLNDFFFCKSSEWEYEKEWRMVRPVSNSSQDLLIEGQKVHLFEYPFEALKAIILGHRIEESTIKVIEMALASNDHLKHVSLQKIIIDPSNYRLRVEPV
jgi:hypothetical protein